MTRSAAEPEDGPEGGATALARENARLRKEVLEARASAAAANRLKDEFLSTLSHELRTPLTAIVGWAYLLRGGKLTPEEQVRAVETIIRNATSQGRIIDELLDVSRIITGKVQLDLLPVDLGLAIDGAISTLAPAARAKGIQLQVVRSATGTSVMGDPERLQQIFWNLLSNAIKFTPAGGRVVVNVDVVGSNVEVGVTDTGLGIDEDFLPHLFDRFTQNDSSSTRPSGGLGLGLSIVRQLVELHGGAISATSAGVGEGATFIARFPRTTLAARSSVPKSDQNPDIRGVRVLIVEDDGDARDLIEKMLETQGARVTSIPTAREALLVLDREPFDVLLSDIEMAGKNGYEFIRELRRRPNESGGSLPAAALTAHASVDDRDRALRAGFHLHLAKPVHPSELVTVVADLAARGKV